VIGALDPVTIAKRSPRRDVHRCRSNAFFRSGAKNHSIAALSPHDATLLVDPSSPSLVRTRTNFIDRNRDRRSERTTHPTYWQVDRVVLGADGQRCFHVRVRGMADNPVRVRVHDRTETERAFISAVSGDVVEPQGIWPVRGGFPLHQIVVDGRSRVAAQPFFVANTEKGWASVSSWPTRFSRA